MNNTYNIGDRVTWEHFDRRGFVMDIYKSLISSAFVYEIGENDLHDDVAVIGYPIIREGDLD